MVSLILLGIFIFNDKFAKLPEIITFKERNNDIFLIVTHLKEGLLTATFIKYFR